MKTWMVGALALGVMCIHALLLSYMGQPWISASGVITLWEGVVLSPENSQNLTDWYTFSHVIHGFLFYWFLSYFFPRLSVGMRCMLALGVEVGWELLENSPIIINRYRETALALGYSGDSIINSVSDVVAMVVGFIMARKMPVLFIVILAIGMELGVGYMIRDNLTLNIINLVYPVPALQMWQQAM